MHKTIPPATNIVVTCWNALDYTRATFESLFKSTLTDYYLTVINNGSENDTEVFLASLKLPDNCRGLRVITNNKNMGPGYAANQGFAVSLELGTEFTCLCNNDLYFQTDWLAKLERAASNEKVAMAGPLRPATSVRYDSKLSTTEKLKSIGGYTNWREELIMYTATTEDNFDHFARKIIEVNGGGISMLESPPDALSSCCVLIRNAIFEKEFGYLADPRFVHYGSEDSDMTWAVGTLGYDCVVLKDVYVHHFRGKSLSENNADRASLILDSNNIFFEKWKKTIYKFLKKELALGTNIDLLLKIDRGDKYWFLQRLNRDTKFWSEGAIDESRFL